MTIGWPILPLKLQKKDLKVAKLLNQLTGCNGSRPLIHKTSSYTTYLPTKPNGYSVLYFNMVVSRLDTRKYAFFFLDFVNSKQQFHTQVLKGLKFIMQYTPFSRSFNFLRNTSAMWRNNGNARAKYLFTSRDDLFENMRETTVLASEMSLLVSVRG